MEFSVPKGSEQERELGSTRSGMVGYGQREDEEKGFLDLGASRDMMGIYRSPLDCKRASPVAAPFAGR